MNYIDELAQQITKKSSQQAYFTIKVLADRHLVNDCYKGYAYFRWVDDMVDEGLNTKQKRLHFIYRQEQIINQTYAGKKIKELSHHERLIVDLIYSPTGKDRLLRSFIQNFLAIIKFDAGRIGRLITQKELDWYTHTLAVAVTDCMQHFIGHRHRYPKSKYQYLAANAAHVVHMLRDYLDDIDQGIYNIPREYLSQHKLDPQDINAPALKLWVKHRIDQASDYFIKGKSYLDSLDVYKCRLAGYWYSIRFESIIEAIKKDNYLLRPDYPERKHPKHILSMIKMIPNFDHQKNNDTPGLSIKKSNQVVIIGAGIGGLATAIKLQQNGFRVTILEQNSRPGGRCQQIVRNGHIFDSGPTMYLFPHIYENFFLSVNENIHDHLELLPVDPIYLLHFADHTKLSIGSDPQLMRSQLEYVETGSFARYQAYLRRSRDHYQLAMERITQNSMDHLFDYFNPTNLYLLLKHHALKSHYAMAKDYFTHPHLQAAFTFQDSYLSLDPFTAPAIFSLFNHAEINHGSYLPQGGMYQIIKGLENIALNYGVKITYRSPVSHIIHDHQHASAIILKDRSKLKADYIISNADLAYTYQKLLTNDPYTPTIQRKKHSCSALIFHWGLDKKYSALKTHNLFFSGSYRSGFEQVIDRSQPPSNPHFYIQAPTRVDPSRAPKGGDTLSAFVPINHINPQKPQNWLAYQDIVRRYILEQLHTHGYKHIKDHIKFEISYIPTDWQAKFNLHLGSVYGLHHDLTQMGYFRPHRQHSAIKNLFFVGASNHPGSGLPTVLLSSLFTSQKIINYDKSLNKLK